MESGELADHLRDDVVELTSVGDPIDERHVAILHGRPVDPLHLTVIEVVALEPPRVDEELTKFDTGVGQDRPARKIDLRLARGLWFPERLRGRVRIDDEEVVVLSDEHLLPVGRNLIALHVAEDEVRDVSFLRDFGGILGLVADVDACERFLGRQLDFAV